MKPLRPKIISLIFGLTCKHADSVHVVSLPAAADAGHLDLRICFSTTDLAPIITLQTLQVSSAFTLKHYNEYHLALAY